MDQDTALLNISGDTYATWLPFGISSHIHEASLYTCIREWFHTKQDKINADTPSHDAYGDVEKRLAQLLFELFFFLQEFVFAYTHHCFIVSSSQTSEYNFTTPESLQHLRQKV